MVRSLLPPVYLLLLPLLGAPAAQAQSEAVDAYVPAEMQKRKIPGLSLAVVRNGQVVKATGYGLANVEHNVPASAGTVYQIGSVGKQFTATLVMMLAEEGKLSLDDPIGKHLPEAPDIWKPVTVRHLLSHTAGFSNGLYRQINMRQDYTEAELLKQIAALPLDFEPGTKWSYSNPGYVTLGILIHRVTGKFYGDLLRERVFAPLGMNTARIINEADIIPNRAAGYRLANGELRNQEWVAPQLNTTADGSLYMTVLDLAKWDAALHGERVLRRASLDRMWTPTTLTDGKTHPYGFGWSVSEVNGRRLIQHGGAWQGFTAQISRFVDDSLTVIVLTNLAGADPGSIAQQVAGRYVPALRVPDRTAIQIDPRVVDGYVGEYELAPGFILTITREGNRFYVTPTNQNRAEMFPESETKFFLTVVDAQLTFMRDASGKVTHLVLHQGGDHQATRIK